MPNWCHNRMKITGAAEEIARFKQTCINGNQGVDFNAVIPMPAISTLWNADPMPYPPTQEWIEREVERVARWAEATGYKHPNDWAWDHWGTKWNARDSCVGKDEVNCVEYFFATAWGPPVPVWEKMGELFPTLEFELSGSEPLADFAFQGTIHAGRVELHDVPVVWKTVAEETQH
jgi:hypothetical protein